jgi:hypothetical protein
MQPSKGILTSVTLITALTLSAATMAADLPKEGTFSGTYAGALTFKTYPVGKEGTLLVFDDNSLTVGKGFLDHMTWHCFGISSITTGMEHFSGYCVVTDPAGDQIAADITNDESFPADAKSRPAKGTFTTGTGKYAGISGSLTNVLHTPEFRSAVDGTKVRNGDMQASYKLP